MFDVYSTLQHLLHRTPMAHPTGVSLFTPISPNRSCAQAGIPIQYCLCGEFLSLERSALWMSLAERLIERINEQITELEPLLCGRLQLGKVISLKRYTFPKMEDDDLPEDGRLLRLGIRFTAAPPSGALFEVTLQVEVSTEKGTILSEPVLLGEIDRLDTYREQSACVAGRGALERYCYCQ